MEWVVIAGVVVLVIFLVVRYVLLKNALQDAIEQLAHIEEDVM